ncbi:MAG TPA: peptidylprolyl isomerase, partial [Bacteroidia bacterium]|nr:peptidylprolyl isomerase [Bacteroidia bacterium]
ADFKLYPKRLMKRFSTYSIFSLALISATYSNAQQANQLVDQVAAVIGSKIILQSDVQKQYAEYVAENLVTGNTKCMVLEDLMFQKLLLLEAERDTTMIISEEQVDQELNKRMEYYISQFGGSKTKFETFYGKTVEQFKDEYRPDVKDLLLAQQMRNKVVEGITVSPEDVRKYFQAIPKDSVPDINAQVEIGEIVKMPTITDEEKQIAKQSCEDLRQRVLKGESLATLAILYSDDPGSAKNGGEYKNVKRAEFVPEFDKVLFSLNDGEVSTVFETPFGYHFIQMERRHGELADFRHILKISKVSPNDLQRSADQLDSIYKMMKKDTIPFSEAAAKFSEDKDTKYNGGLLINPQTGQNRWDMNQLGQIDPTLAFTLNGMNIGDITPTPQQYSSRDAKQGYRLIYLKNRTKPHKANLTDDYQQIQAAALNKKQQSVVHDWIIRKLKEGVYVHIDATYNDCHFQNGWVSAP